MGRGVQNGTVPFWTTLKTKVRSVVGNETVSFWTTPKTGGQPQNNDETLANANVVTPEPEIPEGKPNIVKKTCFGGDAALLKGLKP